MIRKTHSENSKGTSTHTYTYLAARLTLGHERARVASGAQDRHRALATVLGLLRGGRVRVRTRGHRLHRDERQVVCERHTSRTFHGLFAKRQSETKQLLGIQNLETSRERGNLFKKKLNRTTKTLRRNGLGKRNKRTGEKNLDTSRERGNSFKIGNRTTQTLRRNGGSPQHSNTRVTLLSKRKASKFDESRTETHTLCFFQNSTR